MSDKYSAMLAYFNKPVNQAEAFKQTTYNDVREAELIYKDVKDEPSMTKFPVNLITQTIGITPAAKANGDYEPIGSETHSIDFIEPLFQKTIQEISVDEMEFYRQMYADGGAAAFMQSKADASMLAFDLFVTNMKKMALTGTINQTIRDEVNNTMIVGKTINYGTLIGTVDTRDDSATFDISAAATTKEQFWNYLEKERKAKNLSTNGSRFRAPSDVDVFFDSAMFSFAVGLLTGQATGNALMGTINPDGSLNFGGYRLHDLAAPYSTWTKGLKDVWANVSANAVASKYIQMIDTVNGKHMQRNLRVATTDGSADRSPFYMEMVQKEDKSGYKLFFRAKPLVVFDTTASISRKIDV